MVELLALRVSYYSGESPCASREGAKHRAHLFPLLSFPWHNRFLLHLGVAHLFPPSCASLGSFILLILHALQSHLGSNDKNIRMKDLPTSSPRSQWISDQTGATHVYLHAQSQTHVWQKKVQKEKSSRVEVVSPCQGPSPR